MILTVSVAPSEAVSRGPLTSVTLVVAAIESVTSVGACGVRKVFWVHMCSGKSWVVAYDTPEDTITAHRELLLKLHGLDRKEANA